MDKEEKYFSNLERLYVHNVYENISTHYDDFYKLSKIANQSASSETRASENVNINKSNDGSSNINSTSTSAKKETHKYKAWPKVKKFIKQLERNALLADIGCGEGKYLNLTSEAFSIGCDRSSSLCQLAASHKSNQILICDNLSLPFRSEIFDAVVSIGVIHHFSTVKRRIQAIQELARILRPGGKIMIYVWAMEQHLRKFHCQDVLVPLLNTNSTVLSTNNAQENLRRSLSNKSYTTEDNYQYKSDSIQNSTDSVFREDTDCNLTVRENDLITLKNLELNSNDEKKHEKCLSNPNESDSSEINILQNLRSYIAKKINSEKEDKNGKEKLNLNRQSSCNVHSFFESYKNIIEDYKEILPKNFKIRRFPSSSCSDTFSPNIEGTSYQSMEEKQINNLNSEDQKYALASESKKLLGEADILKPSEKIKEEDAENNQNKRFYHVFKKDELNNLIRNHCKDLLIYESSYDHGNWCICAIKNH